MAGSSEPAFSFLYTKIKDPAKPGSSENKKSARRDSNPRPPPWQGGVLPLNYVRIAFFI